MDYCENIALLSKYLHKFYNKLEIPSLIWNSFYEGNLPCIFFLPENALFGGKMFKI